MGLSFQQVAEMCDTIDNEIRKTYYHLIDDRRLADAIAGYSGAHGLQRDLITELETSALTPKRGEILRLYDRDLNAPSSTLDQLVKPKRPLSKLVQ